jgi:glucose uptake protein GlcU
MICALGALAFFFGVELEDFIVSSTSRTLTILFLLGVIAGPFWVFGTSISAEGLKISDVFVPSALGSPIFSAFGVAVSSSVFYACASSLASVAEEVSPTNSGTIAGSMKRGR